MKKLITLSIAAITATVMASAAYAGSDLQQQRLAQRNFEYFQQMGNKSSGAPIVANPDYQFNSRPEQRLAQRNFDYFQKIGYKGGEVKAFNPYTDVSEYPFTGSVLSAERGGYVFSPARKR